MSGNAKSIAKMMMKKTKKKLKKINGRNFFLFNKNKYQQNLFNKRQSNPKQTNVEIVAKFLVNYQNLLLLKHIKIIRMYCSSM